MEIQIKGENQLLENRMKGESMTRSKLNWRRLALCLTCFLFVPLAANASQNVGDLSWVRGINYTPAGVSGHSGFWGNYDSAVVERDLSYAVRLNINQLRVFLSYDTWSNDKASFREHLIQFIRACDRQKIGVMLVLAPGRAMVDDPAQDTNRQMLSLWVEDLVKAVGNEPGLAFWDAANEPDNLGYPVHNLSQSTIQRHMEFAKWMATTVHKFDKRTPVTIGCNYVACMEELSTFVDVLSYHDYSPTRGEIRSNIDEAKRFAAQVHKPVFNTEMACIARANPYDTALKEYQEAGMGWYIWELMITQYWGDVHGVFYPNGTVRDPSIPAAILGIFRNAGPGVVLENPDREGWVTRAVTDGKKWLDEPEPNWNKGLDIAETEANLLEAAQLVAMRDPPTRTVEALRAGGSDVPALQAAIRKFIAVLEPYENKSQPKP